MKSDLDLGLLVGEKEFEDVTLGSEISDEHFSQKLYTLD